LDKASKSDFIITILNTAQILLIPTHVCCASPMVGIGGAGHAMMGYRMGCGSCHKCQELAGSGAPRYVLNETNKV